MKIVNVFGYCYDDRRKRNRYKPLSKDCGVTFLFSDRHGMQTHLFNQKVTKYLFFLEINIILVVQFIFFDGIEKANLS